MNNFAVNIVQLLAHLSPVRPENIESVNRFFLEQQPSLTKVLAHDWQRYRARIKPKAEDYVLYQGRIIIPYGKGKAALLPLNNGLVTFIDFDFDNPSDDMKVKAEKVTLARKAVSLADALATWSRSGFKMASETDYAKRLEICQGCEFWNGAGYLGMGACNKCGCSGAKLRFATSKCPIEKWQATV